MKNFIVDKENFNFAVNIDKVIGIKAPVNPAKNGQYYIMFLLDKQEDNRIFWFYNTKEERDLVYDNFLIPNFTFLS